MRANPSGNGHRLACLFAALPVALALASCEVSPTGRKRVTLIPDAQMALMDVHALRDLPGSAV